MERIRLNIALIPDEETRAATTALSQEYADHIDTFIVLDSEKMHPHVTLYSPDFSKENFSKIHTDLSQIADKAAAINLKLTAIEPSSTGGISANYAATEEIKQLRSAVMTKLSPYRNGFIREKFLPISKFNHIEQTQIENFGYPINRYHFPHITLSQNGDKNIVEKLLQTDLQQKLPQVCNFREIIIGETGLHGTIINILDRFSLQG